MGNIEASNEGGEGIVLHVLSYDLARGAERYARALVNELDRGSGSHRVLTLFASETGGLAADFELGVPMRPFRRFGLDPRVLIRLRRALADIRPAVVVSHGGEPAKYVALVAPRSLPMVYVRIGSMHPRLANPIRRLTQNIYLRRSNAIVAVSTNVADELVRIGVDSSRVRVIVNGRDANSFKPAPADRVGPPRLIFVGHLDAGKRPDLFVSTVAELRVEGIDFDATMVGDGPLRATLESAAQSAGIEMLGERDDVPQLLTASDILVLTSRPPEGMPGVLIEAGLTGIPVVATRVPGADEVVEPGVTGILVDVDDTAGLVAGVLQLMTDAALRTSMGSAARLRCVEQFSFDATLEAWNELLELVR
jgi:glycosyltransferase involved in cell wall biosynthesis